MANQNESVEARRLEHALSHQRNPLAIDLFCGLGGWADGLLAEGWDVIGFDIERHRYPRREFTVEVESQKSMHGKDRHGNTLINRALEQVHGFHRAPFTGEWDEYPGQLVLQDVLTIHGSQFKTADLIVCSPPCQEFSYMSMPWKRAKQIAAALRGEQDGSGGRVEFPDGYRGSRTVEELKALFDACFRIQREASEAAGRHIPMVVENVKGAQPWVGRAKANYGSFYLWGDVRSVGGRIVAAHQVQFGQTGVKAYRAQKSNPDGTQHGTGSWFAVADSKNRGASKLPAWQREFGLPGEPDPLLRAGRKVPMNFHEHEKTGRPGRSFQSAAVASLTKDDSRLIDGRKGLDGNSWIRDRRKDPRPSHGNSPARKAASAAIAKIPFGLANYIARCFKPDAQERVA